MIEVRLGSGELINLGKHLMLTINKVVDKLSEFELERQLRDILSSQCSMYRLDDESINTWPWIQDVCRVYAEKNHIIKSVMSLPSDIHAVKLNIEYLDGESIETLKKSINSEVYKIKVTSN